MKNGKLQVGQIGCGAFAEGQDFPNFAKNPDSEVKWCCDISKERAKAMADKFRIEKVTSDYHEVINDPEIDMIKIATSHEIHLPIIEAAAANGKHVFCEKPMAMKTEEGLKIISAVKKNKIKLCVDLNRRMSPAMHALKKHWQDHLAEPKHQPWRYIETDRELLPEEKETQLLIRIQDESMSYRLVHLDPLRGGGQIIGESVHWLDLACWFFAPQRPVEIHAWGSARLSHGIFLKFSGGDSATIIFNCGGTFDYPKELYEVTSHGALLRSLCFVENNYYGIPGLDKEIFPLQHDSMENIGQEGGFDGFMKKHQARVSGIAGNSKAGHSNLTVDKGHENMLNSFVKAILKDTESPCDEISGFTATYLAKQAIKSIELNHPLPVPVDKLEPCMV
jgi:predicted dehydrogenase